MRTRVLIAAAIALSTRAGAQPARPLWHAVVQPSRAGLPAVSVDLGYPGPYVPAINTPLVLGAVAGRVPFDGYIGFHFQVRGRRTIDAPVVARANLGPHEAWTFSTIATVRKWGFAPDNGALPREIAVEWRDRSMHLLDEQSAGVPPWTTFAQKLLPLCVECSSAFGSGAFAARAAALPDFAQWYAGFSSVVVSLPVWIELPQRVKEAIFGSGIYVVFIGTPRPAQQLDAITRALLPVVFAPQPGAYVAPWPYRTESAIASSVSWRVKQGAGAAGVPNELPYIVRSEAAAWAADAGALARPLPSVTPTARRALLWFHWETATKPSFGQRYRPAIASAIALLIAVLAWVTIRNDRFAIAAAVVIAAAAAVAAGRDWLRPNANGFEHVLHASVAPGIAITLRDVWQYGPAPLRGPQVERTRLTGDYGLGPDQEIRTSRTAPSMGELHREQDWDAANRWSFRRELAAAGTAARIVVPDFRDFHGSMILSAFSPVAQGDRYQIDGDLHTLDDGRMSCAFALPSNVSQATLYITMPLMGGPIELSWANGNVRLQPVQKDPYTAGECAIPTEVLRAANAAGSMITVTLTTKKPAIQPTYRVTLTVQEKKS